MSENAEKQQDVFTFGAFVYRKTIEEHHGMQKRVLHEPIKCLKMLSSSAGCGT